MKMSTRSIHVFNEEKRTFPIWLMLEESIKLSCTVAASRQMEQLKEVWELFLYKTMNT